MRNVQGNRKRNNVRVLLRSRAGATTAEHKLVRAIRPRVRGAGGARVPFLTLAAVKGKARERADARGKARRRARATALTGRGVNGVLALYRTRANARERNR